MFIKSLYLRRFRSLFDANIDDISNFNVFIGKNNAGKSTVLAAIDMALNHLKSARVAHNWRTRSQPESEFSHKNLDNPIQIEMTFMVTPAQDEEIRSLVAKESPGSDAILRDLRPCATFSAIVSAGILNSQPTIYIESLARGDIDRSDNVLRVKERPFFGLSATTAEELLKISNEITGLRGDITALENLREHPNLEYYFRDYPGGPRAGISSVLRNYSNNTQRITRIESSIIEYDTSFTKISSRDIFMQFVDWLTRETENKIEGYTATQTTNPIQAFSGVVYIVPQYVSEICRNIMNCELLHLTEDRSAVGIEEASQLLSMKNQRGGMPRLTKLQQTIQGLLGVRLDAFEAAQQDDRRVVRPTRRTNTRNSRGEPLRAAEIDVDDFLVEINGAGIREALRIVLDVELGDPGIVLIEEPEVHLHPGLEKIMHNYLVDKSKERQIFIATHSTSFVDISSNQTIYLLDRKSDKTSIVNQIESEENMLQIPENIGLRPSSVLMFDRLIFVEGPTDEGVFRAFANNLQIDVASAGINFIHTGGSAGFSSFSAEATINLLSRRQIKMWFIIDRDEKNDRDVEKMLARLGARAQLKVFQKREIENYLINTGAIFQVISDRLEKLKKPKSDLSVEIISGHIEKIVAGLKSRVQDLHLGNLLLKPLYPQRLDGSVLDKLEKAKQNLDSLIETAATEIQRITDQIETQWETHQTDLSPGSLILEGIFSVYNLRYDKVVDGPRIASIIPSDEIDEEVTAFLTHITQKT
ncbi:AAA family ATPase [Roseococcus sp. SYP-B2431]|uniref:AAA family ATPase n=1 Tax=Roseococcus sp. SYP-B2431 TaxID=2496640 RepID=UPI0013F491D3|nr:AAA family ATPase [Roseococcus sp. SYP-B2431]